MGKVRVKIMGDTAAEKAQKEKAKRRRMAKKEKKKKEHVKGVGLKGGEQIKVVTSETIKPEVKKLLEKEKAPTEKADAVKPKKPRERSKRYKKLRKQVDKHKTYSLKDAVKLTKNTANTKFDSTVEAHINLHLQVLSKKQPTLSGAVNLPHGTGKKRVIAVASDKLLKQIEQGEIDFDVLVAHPSMMAKIAKFARVLGPKGLMPNPKAGTISEEPEKRARELENGEISWKNEPGQPVIHFIVGKVSFAEKALQENTTAVVKAVGVDNIAKLTLTSTMGPGIKVNVGEK